MFETLPNSSCENQRQFLNASSVVVVQNLHEVKMPILFHKRTQNSAMLPLHFEIIYTLIVFECLIIQ